jgi:hypothetical protein
MKKAATCVIESVLAQPAARKQAASNGAIFLRPGLTLQGNRIFRSRSGW